MNKALPLHEYIYEETLPAKRRMEIIFNLAELYSQEFNMELVENCFDFPETVVGDKFKISVENMLRLAPLVSPVMHKINVTTHYFFVPNRILWDEWEDWITGELDAVPPQITAIDDLEEGDLGDYMGLPTDMTVSTGIFASAFPFAAY